MTDPRTCPKCGTALPPDAPEGACPRCLLAAGLEDPEEGDRKGAAAPEPEDIARHFPRLEVLELLGQGGMGIVYKARQRDLDRLVALKVVPPEVAREKNFAERFGREARTLARLHHPNIVGVHDFGESDGLYYLLMEFVDGPNLRQVLKEGKLPAKQALAIVPQICDALQYAHDQGVVHRDIKPENILLDRDGKVRIADFGLAKLARRTPVELTITRTGQVMGTLHYMAPEQYRNPDEVDHRADIYSLGVVFYEMLTGELPLGRFEPPSHKPGVDARLDQVVLRALERERDRRWQKASEVRTRIDSISGAPAPPGAKPPVVAGGAARAADAAGPRPPVTPGPPPFTGDPRLSRLAVAGALAVPASAVLLALPLLLAESGAYGVGPLSLAAFVVAGLLCMTGLALSFAGWSAIRHSGGRLHGVGWAATGVFLSPVLCCGGAATMLAFYFGLVTDTAGIGIREGPEGTRVILPGLEVEDGPGGTRVKLPGFEYKEERNRRNSAPAPLPEPAVPKEPTKEQREEAALKVLGGPDSLDDADRARILADLETQWRDAWPLLGETNPEVLASHFAPADRERFAAMSEEERKGERSWQRLGMLFVNPMTDLAKPLGEYRVFVVRLAEDGATARVVRSTGLDTIAYPVVRDGDLWCFSLGPFELWARAPIHGDRDGWLEDRFHGEGGDPAGRVAGGPAGRAAWERHRDIEFLRRGWRDAGPDFVRETFPDWSGGPASDFRPHHLALDATGNAGRLVLSDGKAALAIPVERDGDVWVFLAAGVEFRFEPAGPDDRDGHLFR